MFVDGGSGKPERNIYSLDSLISWLETKNPRGEYNFLGCKSCLLAQYFTEMGLKGVHVRRDEFIHRKDEYFSFVYLPEHFDNIASGYVEKPRWYHRRLWTFGKALKRAYKVRARNNAGPARGLLDRLVSVFAL